MQMANDHCRLFFKGSLRGVDDRVDHAPAEMQAIGSVSKRPSTNRPSTVRPSS
jgi:hypothetical protein